MSQRVAIVTGGGRGIGAAICRALAEDGLRVLVADIDAGSAADTAAGLPGSGHGADTVDVSDEGSVDRLFAAAEERFGPAAVLVCNAGILLLRDGGERAPIWETALDEWERSHAVNARGTFLCTRAFLRRRVAQPLPNGRIVTMGSVAAQLGGYRSSSAYIASKAAVLGYTKALAREAAPYGITVNAVAPGMIDAPMLRLSLKPGDEAAAASGVPINRIGTPEDVAAAVRFLVSEPAGYVTGATIDVNGGYRMQ